MPRRERPERIQRSEHWLRMAVNEFTPALNSRINALFKWDVEQIEWLSPIAADDYAEYFDGEFLTRLGVSNPKVPLSDFWPESGPRWDGLAKTASGKLILVEAKAYIEEGVDYKSGAGPRSLGKISAALSQAKSAFAATDDGESLLSVREPACPPLLCSPTQRT
jgi:hypothetical protein